MAQKVKHTPTPLHDLNPRIESWKKPRVYVVGLDEDVKKMFVKYGYIVRSGHFTEEVFDDIDFVCFTGGGDLNPRLYGQKMAPETSPDSFRDLEEVEVFHRYPNTPKVGICRGLQLINVLHGGTMIQHVNNHVNKGDHDIVDVWGKTLRTSSVHHQMCVPPMGASNVLAWATNLAYKNSNDPEVIWYPDTQSIGVQGHPEWGPDEFTDYFMVLLKNFVLPVCNYKQRNMPGESGISGKVLH